MAKRFDRQLLKLITQGRAAFDQNGSPVLDDQGQQFMKPPTAADLAVIRGRLRDCGANKMLPEYRDPIAIALDRIRAADHSKLPRQNEEQQQEQEEDLTSLTAESTALKKELAELQANGARETEAVR